MRHLKVSQSITVRTENTERFFRDIEKHKLITTDEEIALAERIKNGDKIAEDELIKANLRFVVSVAKQYQYRGAELGDLIGDGCEGMIKAAKRFDASKGFKFISFAVWWVRQSILEGLSKHSRIVRLPGNQLNMLNKYRDALSILEQDLQRSPSPEEIQSFMEINNKQYLNMVEAHGKSVSLDAPFEKEEVGTLLDVIQGSEESTDAVVEMDYVRKHIANSLSILGTCEKDVLIMFYGLENNQPLKMDEISLKMDLTIERVRQIKNKAILRLRHKLHPSIQDF